ncbi:NAD-dependent epimerase/dehydratase family protein [Pricia sp. S334]|uniref:NAD-dependent epimerase/dehydratase family protein n=1 Tax=Pricia mediterranea TaxID=3076079 RepID=A0ABU3L636_9FLAO|nr:NAD-dependent epimerase/dehydratase family protein [Pricia sp. S334]MDT7829189.1 NAD-dependent epimerase/dehydratase family protein [Pricia sp. S334]
MILVTGGTGLVGAHLLFKLAESGHSIKAIHRKGSNLERVEKIFGYYHEASADLFKTIEWIEADINDIPALEVAFLGVTQVYHAAALISFNPRDSKKLQKTNIEGTANIVNLCIDNSVEKLCYASTIGAIGKSAHSNHASENTPWTPQEANVYGLSKHAAEMEVWRGSQEGLPVVMVNPGVIIGPGFWDSGSGALFTTAQNTYGFYPPGGTGFISVHDVVDMMYGLMESNNKNERFIAVAKNWTYQKILTEITLELGIKPPKRRLKFWQLEIGRWFDWTKDLFFRNGRTITKSHIKSLKNRQIFDNGKISSALDFEFRPIQDEIRFCCQKFKEEHS